MWTEESFLIRIKDSNKWYFWKVKPLTKQVDTNQYIVYTLPEIIHNLHTLQSVDITVDIIASYIIIKEIFGQFFSHTFGESSDKHTFAFFDTKLDFFH